MMKENAKTVLAYLKENHGEKLTAADVAEATGIAKKSVDGIFTSFQKKTWGVRKPAEIELADGSHKQVKFLVLTEEGLAVDPDKDAE